MPSAVAAKNQRTTVIKRLANLLIQSLLLHRVPPNRRPIEPKYFTYGKFVLYSQSVGDCEFLLCSGATFAAAPDAEESTSGMEII
jgi:hypothetical protein